MVSPTYIQPQVFGIDNLSDAFRLVSQGFEAYQNAAAATPTGAGRSTPSPSAQTQASHPQAQAQGQSERPVKKQKSYQPDVDILETQQSVIVEVSLPGVQKQDINIEYDAESNRIVLTGTSERVQRQETRSIRHERPSGPFERIVGLNKQAILPDQISATHDNGILTLTIPKNVEAETKRKITIS